MSKAPFVSLIIPVYKVESRLSKCIESVLCQTFNDFEIVLIDDGSPDKSGAICDLYATKDRRVRVFHQQNQGVSVARNLGLDNALGRWVTFVDSDDYIGNTYLENLIGTEKLIETDLIMIGNTHVDEKGNTSGKSFLFPEMIVDIINDKNLEQKLERGKVFRYGITFGHLYNLDMIRKHNIAFLADMCLHEDHMFHFCYLKHVKKIILRPAANYYYVINTSTISLSKSQKTFEELDTAFQRLKGALREVLKEWHLKGGGDSIKSFLLNVQLNAIHSLYVGKRERQLRLHALSKLSRRDVALHYKPQSLNGYFQYICLVLLPNNIIDKIYMKFDKQGNA